ncbi:MAG TPA: polyprenyl synthetase family protein [Candidatus Nanoarchaeia archaeon]|nr:(2E,6E)-farnesyl diphosphate synthase [uncultured archaeon]
MAEIPSLLPNSSGFETTYGNEARDALDYLAWFKKQFDRQLFSFLDQKKKEASEIDPQTQDLVGEIIRFGQNGGKRIRPAFMYAGYISSGGQAHEAILFATLSVELLHTFALIHDDIMDKSDLRRGQLTTHRQFTKLHQLKNLRGKREDFGLAAAILAGDLSYSFAEEIFTEAPFPQERVRRARYFFDQMKTQVVYGQYLDVLGGYKETLTEDEVLKILEYKTAKYTVERPLHLGAMLAGADYQILEAFSRYAIPLGQAFQIQDDILGTFGSEKEIGKPADSDIKEGKKTLLVVKAMELASQKNKNALKSLVGKPDVTKDEIEKVRKIIEETGSLDYCVKLSRELLRQAKEVVTGAKLKPEGKNYLIAAASYLETRI